jgi:GAF domain-containing protein
MKANDSRPISYRDEFEAQLAEHGVRGGLAWLNGRTQYRYTALYLVDGGVLKNVYVFDRSDPTDKPYLNTPINESYCNLVMEAEQAVIVTDALHDPRTAGHPYSTVIRSFCGLPLQRADGSAFGALCHFDEQPREIAVSERAVLDAARGVLGRTLEQISKL